MKIKRPVSAHVLGTFIVLALSISLGICLTLIISHIVTGESSTETEESSFLPSPLVSDDRSERHDDEFNSDSLITRMANTLKLQSPLQRRTQQLLSLEHADESTIRLSIIKLLGSTSEIPKSSRPEILVVLLEKFLSFDSIRSIKFNYLSDFDVTNNHTNETLIDQFDKSTVGGTISDDLNQWGWVLKAIMNTRNEFTLETQVQIAKLLGIEQLLIASQIDEIAGLSEKELPEKWDQVMTLVQSNSNWTKMLIELAVQWVLNEGIGVLVDLHESTLDGDLQEEILVSVLYKVAELEPKTTFDYILHLGHDRYQMVMNESFRNWTDKDPKSAWESLLLFDSELQHTLLLHGWINTASYTSSLYPSEEKPTHETWTTSALESLARAFPKKALDWIEQEILDVNFRSDIEYSILDELTQANPVLALNLGRTLQGRALYKVIDTLLEHNLQQAVDLLPKFDQHVQIGVFIRVGRELLLRGDVGRMYDLAHNFTGSEKIVSVHRKYYHMLLTREWYRLDNEGFVQRIENQDLSDSERSFLILDALLHSHKVAPPTLQDFQHLTAQLSPSDLKKLHANKVFKFPN